MSQVGNELKMLFYLNAHYKRYVKIQELADLLEVTPRQIRRYRIDLDDCKFFIDSKSGEDGGYRLQQRLSRALMIPENIMLALNIAARNNTSLIKELNELPVVPKMTEVVHNANVITDDELEKASIIVNGINKKKVISFMYEHKKGLLNLTVKPYKLFYTNHTYYLRALDDDILKSYDIDKMNDIKEVGEFTIDDDIVKRTDEELSYYGLKDDKIVEVVLSYSNSTDIRRIDRVFEYKGVIDEINKTYTVKSRSLNELFYPLFSLGSKVRIENEDVKKEYIHYLYTQLNVLK